jgi:predicted GNAT superfamily acetyltransferase
MSTLTPGDGLLLRAFVHHPSPTVKLSYGAPKGKQHYHLALWLGIWTEGDASVDQRLNALGWVYDPERARAALKEAGRG